MPKGKPRTTAERKARHSAKFGTSKDFPSKRKGKNRK